MKSLFAVIFPVILIFSWTPGDDTATGFELCRYDGDSWQCEDVGNVTSSRQEVDTSIVSQWAVRAYNSIGLKSDLSPTLEIRRPGAPVGFGVRCEE